jgi:hypothetical protein
VGRIGAGVHTEGAQREAGPGRVDSVDQAELAGGSGP